MKNFIRRDSCRIPFLLLPLQCSPSKALSLIFDAGDDPGFLLFYRLDKTFLFIPRNRFESYFSLITLILAKITYFSEYITEISSIFKRQGGLSFSNS